MLHHLKITYCSKYFQEFSDVHAGMKQKSSFRYFLSCDFSLSVVSNLEVIFINLRLFKKKISAFSKTGEQYVLFKCGYTRELP